jgi:hypothetical protein
MFFLAVSVPLASALLYGELGAPRTFVPLRTSQPSVQGAARIASGYAGTFIPSNRIPADAQQTSWATAAIRSISPGPVRQEPDVARVSTIPDLARVTSTVNQTWQHPADVGLKYGGALSGVSDTPSALGIIFTKTLSANLYSASDIAAFSTTEQQSGSARGEYSSSYRLAALSDEWVLGTSVHVHTERDPLGMELQRITPGLKLTYRWNARSALEATLDYEKIRITSPTQHDDVQNRVLYVGYRIEF